MFLACFEECLEDELSCRFSAVEGELPTCYNAVLSNAEFSNWEEGANKVERDEILLRSITPLGSARNNKVIA